MAEPFACNVDNADTSLAVDATGLVGTSSVLAHTEVDFVRVAGRAIELLVADGSSRTVTKLGARHDEFLAEYSDAWRRARRAALLQWTGDAPIDEYAVHTDDGDARVVLFPDGITVESWTAVPSTAPFGLITTVEREGHAVTIQLRAGLSPVVVRGLGRRTDDFVAKLERARLDAATATAAAYAALSPDLAGYTAPDGWSVTETEAGRWWASLRAAVAAQGRSQELETIENLTDGAVRLGIKAGPAGTSFPFVIAGRGNRVAVEGLSNEEARATLVFSTADIDRLNAVLVLTSFRREAITSPEAELGRWAPAVRLLEPVRWARAALVGRIVHDASWDDKIAAVLG